MCPILVQHLHLGTVIPKHDSRLHIMKNVQFYVFLLKFTDTNWVASKHDRQNIFNGISLITFS